MDSLLLQLKLNPLNKNPVSCGPCAAAGFFVAVAGTMPHEDGDRQRGLAMSHSLCRCGK